eukprot:TRINITY_DN25902_c0_g1_i1.p1 TRINITY_DN25902_c0_g1~~TRINITY_DN25902_c0_g1_i1.p1  ORF type:complete len:672 (-),score=60.66 TRINITY_DN25902_c0_g1_i1:14-1933(-)
MELTVTDAEGVPENAYISVRVGDTRQQMRYKSNRNFHFDAKRMPWFVGVDVLESVGSAEVWLSDFSAVDSSEDGIDDESRELEGCFDVPRKNGDGAPMKLRAKLSVNPNLPDASRPGTAASIIVARPGTAESQTWAAREGASARLKRYVEKHGLHGMFQSMLHSVLTGEPDDPLSFLIEYLQRQRRAKSQARSEYVRPHESNMESRSASPKAVDKSASLAEKVDHARSVRQSVERETPIPQDETVEANMIDFSEIPGLGKDDCDGFPTRECPEELPDLSEMHSLVAQLLHKDRKGPQPGIYARLRYLRTSNGVSLARCIKPGMDRKGHRMVKSSGLVAGDAECYDLFREIFDPIIYSLHVFATPGHRFRPERELAKLDGSNIDSSGEHVFATRISVLRNLADACFVPAMTFEQRRNVEARISAALLALGGELKGEYLPLRGSKSHQQVPNGMSAEQEQRLAEAGILFKAPDAAMGLSSGFGRDWPDARGVFVSSGNSLVAWVNKEEHLQLIVTREDSDLQAAYQLIRRAEAELDWHLNQGGDQCAFAKSDRYGYLSANPEGIGSGMNAEVHARLPNVCSADDFRKRCKELKLLCRSAGDAVCLSNRAHVGRSEMEQINDVISGARQLVEAEVARQARAN